jgi:hypothetical protein
MKEKEEDLILDLETNEKERYETFINRRRLNRFQLDEMFNNTEI